MAKQQRGFKRTDRLNSQLLEVLSQLFIFEVEDPRAKQVQLTAVDVSPDLSVAKVYYVTFGAEESAFDPAVQQTLERLTGFLRRLAGERLELRKLPELRFVYDESIANGRRIEQLLATVDYAKDEDPSKE